jgi:16S rRNA (guanine527-N7)-methyltransferase
MSNMIGAFFRNAGRYDALRLVPVSRETKQRLDVFIEILCRWRGTTNLISSGTVASQWTRHIADTSQVICLAPEAIRWLDMGTGAGFPGMMLALQLVNVRRAVVHCIESDHRKCAFLREVARATSAPAIIHPVRVESANRLLIGDVDGVSARAFAGLCTTVDMAAQWLRTGATGIFPVGMSVRNELDFLRVHSNCSHSNYSFEVIPSIVDTEALFLRVRIT